MTRSTHGPIGRFCRLIGIGSATIATLSMPAAAAGSLFPTDHAVVPFAVGAAFAFPAIAAGLVAMLRGLAARLGMVASGLALGLIALVAVGILQPHLVMSFRP